MAIYELLSGVKDERTNNGICTFNGYLEDYLSVIEDEEANEMVSVFQALLDKDEDLHICVNLRLNINKDAIANQIIRYKDSFKLPHGTIRCPYILYGTFAEAQKAMILTSGEKEQYILAKALYYVMSEPENEYEGTRNEIIACNIPAVNQETALDAVDRFFWRKEKAGIVQRRLDAKLFTGYEEMYETALHIASYQQEHLEELLIQSEDKEDTINQMIATWFLLKKFVYVQYMMDKNLLKLKHEGNVKHQRQAAKERCDAVGFVSYSELWKLVKEMKQNFKK